MILTRTNAILQTIIGIAPILGAFAVAFGSLGVFAILEKSLPKWMALVAIAIFLGGMIMNLVWCMTFVNFPAGWFMLGRTRRAFERRGDHVVDPQDPDLYFVDIIPRANWGKAMLENASDIGFLKVDKVRHELRFEGDNQRYVIPADSILDVSHEFFGETLKHQLQKQPSQQHLVVVRAMTAVGPWETWFYLRHRRFHPRTGKRRLAESLALEQEISELIPQAETV
jgi:hypothetical protein